MEMCAGKEQIREAGRAHLKRFYQREEVMVLMVVKGMARCVVCMTTGVCAHLVGLCEQSGNSERAR